MNAQARITVDLQSEQNTLDYPEKAGPGSVQAVAIYENDRYYPVDPRIIPVHADQDQQQAAGGDAFAAVQGRPRYFEQRKQLILWPFSDKAYKVRIDYNRPVAMNDDSAVSIVDAQLVIYAAAAMISTQMSTPDMADYYSRLYVDRRAALMAWQSEGTTFALNSEADLGEDEFYNSDLIPHWDRRPTIGPGI